MKLFDAVTSSRTDKVVSSVVHALTSRNPRTHYVIGLDAKAMVLLAMMPACITDFLFRILAVIIPGPGPKRQFVQKDKAYVKKTRRLEFVTL